MTPEDLNNAKALAKSIKDPEALKIAQAIFGMHQDNYSWAARQKQREEEIVQKAVPPIDLSQIDPLGASPTRPQPAIRPRAHSQLHKRLHLPPRKRRTKNDPYRDGQIPPN